MITTLLSILAFAVLFALYGLLRPKGGCTGNCGACRGESCTLSESKTHV